MVSFEPECRSGNSCRGALGASNKTRIFAMVTRTVNQRRLKCEQLEARRLLTLFADLVADVQPGTKGAFLGTEQIVVFRDELYFAANDGSTGVELWKSDGTQAGTQRIKDINSGEASSFPGWFVELNGELYFSSIDSTSGDELWRTDGTSVGTQRVADIYPGEGSASPADLFVSGDLVYFSAAGADNDTELWLSNGSTSGTKQVKDIRSGSGSSNPGGYSGFYEFQGRVYFNAKSNNEGQELWRTDGTSDGTELVIDADNDPQSSWPTNLFEFNGDLYFTAEIFDSGFDGWFAYLFRVDGETGVAQQALNLPIDLDEGVQVVGDWMYFAGLDQGVGYELFRSDGTIAGTTLVRDVMPGPRDSSPRNFLASNGKLFFAASDTRDPENQAPIYSLWVTDGTPLGTREISADPIDADNPFVEYNGEVYYASQSAEHGWELYKTDGNSAGTMVYDVNPGEADSFAIPKRVFEGQLLFLATNITSGWEIWTYDGESAAMIDVAIGGGDVTQEPSVFQFVEFGNDLVFYGSTPFEGLELFIIRGSEQPNRLAGDANEDGKVDFADFLTLSANFGASQASWTEGDFDGNGQVQFGDFLILSGNFGATFEPTLTRSPAAPQTEQATELDTATVRSVDYLFSIRDNEDIIGA